MKRISLALIVLSFALSSHAQVQWNVFGGPSASTVKYSVKNVKQPGDFKFGFHAGAGAKIFFDNQLSFSPSLAYRFLGYKVTFNRPSFPPDLLATDNNTSFHEVDLDVLLQYDFSKNPSHFFIKAGPSLNFVLFGHENYNLATGEHISRSMTFSTMSNYGRYLASLVAQIGYESEKGYFLYAHYMHGLISMNNELDGPAIRMRVLGITVGTRLHK